MPLLVASVQLSVEVGVETDKSVVTVRGRGTLAVKSAKGDPCVNKAPILPGAGDTNALTSAPVNRCYRWAACYTGEGSAFWFRV